MIDNGNKKHNKSDSSENFYSNSPSGSSSTQSSSISQNEIEYNLNKRQRLSSSDCTNNTNKNHQNYKNNSLLKIESNLPMGVSSLKRLFPSISYSDSNEQNDASNTEQHNKASLFEQYIQKTTQSMFLNPMSTLFNNNNHLNLPSSSSASPLISPVEQQSNLGSNTSEHSSNRYHSDMPQQISPQAQNNLTHQYNQFLNNQYQQHSSNQNYNGQIINQQFFNKASAFSPMYLSGMGHQKLMHGNGLMQNHEQAALAAAAMQFNSKFVAAVAAASSPTSTYNRSQMMPLGGQYNSFPYFSSPYSSQLVHKFSPLMDKDTVFMDQSQQFSENSSNISTSSSSSSSSSSSCSNTSLSVLTKYPKMQNKSCASLNSPDSSKALSPQNV